MTPYGPWEPDKGDNFPGICTVADGVVPKPMGYGPASTLAIAQGEALPSQPKGSASIRTSNGDKKVFFWTEDTLHELDVNFNFATIESGLTLTAGHHYDAIQFGHHLLYTNTSQGLRDYNFESGGAPIAIPEAGDPRCLCVVGNMVFGVDSEDDTGARDNRLLRNSDFNDHTRWAVGQGAADYQPFEDGGALLAMEALSEKAALIGQEDALRLLQFTGTGSGGLYSLDLIANARGVVGPTAVVSVDGAFYGLAPLGFFRFTLGNGLEWIGKGRVDDWFLDRCPTDQLKNVQCTADPFRKIIVFRYATPNDAGTDYTYHIIGYNWAFDRWFTWPTDVAYLSQTVTPGYTLATWEAKYATLAETPDITIGDPFWQGGPSLFGAINSELKYARFGGVPMAATLRTSTTNSYARQVLNWATPIDDAPNSLLSVGVQDRLSDPMQWKQPVGKTPSGDVPIRARSRNFGFELTIPEGEAWSYATGIAHLGAQRR